MRNNKLKNVNELFTIFRGTSLANLSILNLVNDSFANIYGSHIRQYVSVLKLNNNPIKILSFSQMTHIDTLHVDRKLIRCFLLKSKCIYKTEDKLGCADTPILLGIVVSLLVGITFSIVLNIRSSTRVIYQLKSCTLIRMLF